jgi:hypothetical protein
MARKHPRKRRARVSQAQPAPSPTNNSKAPALGAPDHAQQSTNLGKERLEQGTPQTSGIEEEPTAARDRPSLPVLAAMLAFKLAGRVLKILWNLTLGIVASIVAALLLLIGVNVVFGFGIAGVLFLIALLQTALHLVFLFLACIATSLVAIGILYRAAKNVSVRRIPVSKWSPLPLVQRRLRRAVTHLHTFFRTQPVTVRAGAIVKVALASAIVLMLAYLAMRDPKAWNATLSVHLPTGAPVGRVGRRETLPQVSTLTDVTRYSNARLDTIAAAMVATPHRGRVDNPLTSRCGSVLPLSAAEWRRMAELYVDITQAPPIVKREYFLTEEQLTATVSAVLRAQGAPIALDCVELHRSYIRFFTTLVDADGSNRSQTLGVSVSKAAGRLRMNLEDLSIGRTSFQVGWLGLGVTGSSWGFAQDAAGAEEFSAFVSDFDSRVFSLEVFEGYLRIVTWRLPSVIAARAAINVGYARVAVPHRVEASDDADSVGGISAGDIVYVLDESKQWLYACLEVSGRCGWLPKTAFTSLGN